MNSIGKPKYPLTRARGARITIQDAKAIAKLVSMRLTEREACAHLDIPRQTWANWKARNRNSERFEEVLEKVKAAKFVSHYSNIEAASVGKGPHQRADWRASECALRLADARYSPNTPSPETQGVKGLPSVQINVLIDGLKLAYAQGRAITDAPPGELRQLKDAPQVEQPEQDRDGQVIEIKPMATAGNREP